MVGSFTAEACPQRGLHATWLLCAVGLRLAAGSKWTIYAGSGTAPDLTVREWASALVARYPDEVEISVWLTTSTHAQNALVGAVDCQVRFRDHPGLCTLPPLVDDLQIGNGGTYIQSNWYATHSNLDLQLLPSIAGPICIVYSKDVTGNLGSLEDRRLNLSMEVVGALYGGHITYWDDPQVQVLNPSLVLPHRRVSVVARRDKSSLNDAVTQSISMANPWWTQVPGYMERAVGKAPKWPLPNYTDTSDEYFVLREGQQDMIVSALRTPFSLAYVDLTNVRRFAEFLGSAHIVSNHSGRPVPPTVETVQNAIDAYRSEYARGDSRLELKALNPPADQAYPITRFTFWYVKKSAVGNGDCYRTWLLKEWILFSYSEAGAAIADRNGWVIPRGTLYDVVRSRVESMHCQDAETGQEVRVMDYMPPRYRSCPSGQFIAARPGGTGVEAFLGCRNCSVGSYQPQNMQSGVFQCAAAPRGTFVSGAGQTAFAYCPSGSFVGLPGQSSCETCPVGKFSPTAGFTQCVDCSVGRSTDGQQGLTLCEFCPPGSYADAPGSERCRSCPSGMTTQGPGSSNAASCTCPPDFYLASPGNCQPCASFEGLECPGYGQPLRAAPGYMMLEAASQPGPPPGFYRCLPASFCLGGGPGACAGGRVGLACASCPNGQDWVDNACQDCTWGKGWVFLLFWWLVPLTLCPGFLIMEQWSTIRMDGDRYLLKIAVTGSVTAFVAIMQVIGLLSLLTVPWPERLYGFVDGTGIFLFNLIDLLSLSCASSAPMGQYALMALVTPLALVVICAAHGAMCILGQSALWDPAFMNAVGTLLFVTFTPLMTSAVTPMMCYTHPTEEKSLIKFPKVLCGSSEHHGMLALGVVLLLTGLAFMSLMVLLTWKAPALSVESDFLRATRFMLLPYRGDRWYTSCVIVPRGLLVALVPVVLADSPRGQVFLFSFIFLVYSAFIARAWPWRLPVLNVLNLVVMELLVVAMVVVATAFVPSATGGGEETSFMGILQALLVLPPCLVGVALGLVLLGVFAGTRCGSSGTWLKCFVNLCDSHAITRDLTAAVAALADVPLGALEKAMASMEILDQKMLLASMQSLRLIGLLDHQVMRAWSEATETGEVRRHRSSNFSEKLRAAFRSQSRCFSENGLLVRSELQAEGRVAGPRQDADERPPTAQPLPAPPDSFANVLPSTELQMEDLA